MNKIVRGFIISEFFFWSAWSTILPLLSIFIIKAFPNSNISIATTAYAFHVFARILTTLTIGKRLNQTSNRTRILVTILGITLVSITYLGLAYYSTIQHIYVFYIIAGIGFGLASPAKYSLFSLNLDKNNETLEWSLYDVVTLGGAALITMISGFIIHQYGFQVMFALAALLNFIGILPFILMLETQKQTHKKSLRRS